MKKEILIIIYYYTRNYIHRKHILKKYHKTDSDFQRRRRLKRN